MGKFIDQSNVEAPNALGPLPAGHLVRKFAARLAVQHPIRDLFEGEFQWLGHLLPVRNFLHLFGTVFADYLRSACTNGLLRTMAPLDQAAITHEFWVFQDIFPNDIVFRGERYRFSDLRRRARHAIEDDLRVTPHLRAAALAAFDHTFARLVRAVRLS